MRLQRFVKDELINRLDHLLKFGPDGKVNRRPIRIDQIPIAVAINIHDQKGKMHRVTLHRDESQDLSNLALFYKPFSSEQLPDDCIRDGIMNVDANTGDPKTFPKHSKCHGPVNSETNHPMHTIITAALFVCAALVIAIIAFFH